MEIEHLIKMLKAREINVEPFITRGKLIDFVAEQTDFWVLTLKALLIKNPKKFISTHYVLEKLNFMKNNPQDFAMFLDYQGLAIFEALLGDLKK